MEEGFRFYLNSPRSTHNGAAKHSTRGHVPRALGSCSPRRWWLLASRVLIGSCRQTAESARITQGTTSDFIVCPGSFRAAGFPTSWNNKEVMDVGRSGMPRRGWRQGREGLGGVGVPVSSEGAPACRGWAAGDLSWRGYFRGGAVPPLPVQ